MSVLERSPHAAARRATFASTATADGGSGPRNRDQAAEPPGEPDQVARWETDGGTVQVPA